MALLAATKEIFLNVEQLHHGCQAYGLVTRFRSPSFHPEDPSAQRIGVNRILGEGELRVETLCSSRYGLKTPCWLI